jgi:hypothetical protein
MITSKTAKRDLGNIRKGETYLSFTGRDADYIKCAAKKVRLSKEELVNKALLMFIDNHSVRGVACENGEAKFS